MEKEWIIPLTWVGTGYISIPREIAPTENDAILYVQRNLDNIPLPDLGQTEYVEGSLACSSDENEVTLLSDDYDSGRMAVKPVKLRMDKNLFKAWAKKHYDIKDGTFEQQLLENVIEYAWTFFTPDRKIHLKEMIPGIPDEILDIISTDVD